MTLRRVRVVAAGLVSGVLAAVVVAPTAAQADYVRDAQWPLRFLDVAGAHRYSQGAGVLVAVVDSGVDGTHPDLAGNVVPGTEVFAGSQGGNGWADTDGHGTSMAGLIAAHGHGAGNADGALGIAPKATILPVRIGISSRGLDIPDGVGWAADHGAKVISISAGHPGSDRGLQDAVEKAIARDIVVVAAAGNIPDIRQVEYPAAYPGVVAVAGVDKNGNHAAVSVTGREVTLSAPAVDIASTGLEHKYGTSTGGTSASTAMVAGAAALVRARFPNLSAVEVIHRLTATAIDKGPPGRDDQYGYGIVDLVGALTADVPPLPASRSASPTKSAEPATAAPQAAPKAPKSPPTWLFAGLGLVFLALVGGVVVVRRRLAR